MVRRIRSVFGTPFLEVLAAVLLCLLVAGAVTQLGPVPPASALGLTVPAVSGSTTGYATWTPTTAPVSGLAPPASTDSQGFLGSVSCPAAGSCVAGGRYSDDQGNEQGLIETLAEGNWTAANLPTAGLSPAPGADPSLYLAGMSCPSTGSCVAAGEYRDAAGTQHGLVATLSSGTWTATTAPTAGLSPPAATSPPTATSWLAGVSCPATGSCVAVGLYTDASAGAHGLIETLSAGTWTATTAPTAGLNPAPGANPAMDLDGVSCPAAGSCVAVGYYHDASGNLQGVIETLSAGTWTATTAPIAGLSPAPGANPGVGLEGVSCPAIGSCVAAGDYPDAAGYLQGLIETLSAGTWTATTAPTTGLSPAVGTPFSGAGMNLQDVSCPSTGSCEAVGYYDDTSGNQQGVIETLSAGTWTATTAPTGGLGSKPWVNLAAVSCPAIGSCVAGGQYTDPDGNLQGLIETQSTSTSPPSAEGYWLAAADGGVFAFDAPFDGSMGGVPLAQPVVGMAEDPCTGGYWLAAADGGVFAFDAPFDGSMAGRPLAHPVVGIAAYQGPSGCGYWLVASDGGVFAFDAPFLGSMGGVPLAQPVVGMVGDSYTGGYWLVAADGGVFTFDAPFDGSMGGVALAQPVVGMAEDTATGGYWLVASDGGVFTFDAPFDGSMGGVALAQPVVGMAEDTATGGYWLVAADGGVFAFDAPFDGSMGGVALARPVVGMAAES